MTELNQIYKCNVCGNMVEVVHTGVGELVCCGQPMELLEEKEKDEGLEKHTPILEQQEDGWLVKIGSVEHPMEEKHYIEWVELLVDDLVYRTYLKPGQSPEVLFSVIGEPVSARAYCNVHGLWRSE